MVKININFSNKAFYLLVSILGLLAITAVVFAYGGSTPAVMGHSSGEIEGTCISWLSDEADTSNHLVIDSSKICTDEDGCSISIHRYSNEDLVASTFGATFHQFPVSNKWGSRGSENINRAGVNGDGNNDILAFSSGLGSCIVYDDSAEENSATQITLSDTGTGACWFRICD
jgi:hypothetical protein